jgi:hypothetical protein
MLSRLRWQCCRCSNWPIYEDSQSLISLFELLCSDGRSNYLHYVFLLADVERSIRSTVNWP